MAFRRPLGLLLLLLALLAAVAAIAAIARPALASSSLHPGADLNVGTRHGVELAPGSFAAVARRSSIPLLRPSRHRMGPAAPPVPSQAASTPLPRRLETGSAATPPVRTPVRVLTGRLNE